MLAPSTPRLFFCLGWAVGKLPAFQFYPRDWLSDPQLRGASHTTKGIWIDILCLMWEAPDRGRLVGSRAELTRMVGATPEDFDLFLVEVERLKFADVTLGNTEVTLENRRMVRDEKARHLTRLRVAKHRSNAPCNTNVTVPSSSSSSSSSSINGFTVTKSPPPKPPKGGGVDAIADELVSLYFERVRKRGARGRAVKAILWRFKAGIPENNLRGAIINCGEFHRAAGTEDKHVMLAETFFGGGWEDARWWPEVTVPEQRAGPNKTSFPTESFWESLNEREKK